MIILTKMNKNNIRSVNNEKNIHLINNYFIACDKYYYFEYKKFKDYYARYYYSFDILNGIEYFNYSGERHREDGPTYIVYYKSEIKYKLYYLNDKMYSYEEYILELNKLV